MGLALPAVFTPHQLFGCLETSVFCEYDKRRYIVVHTQTQASPTGVFTSHTCHSGINWRQLDLPLRICIFISKVVWL